MYAGCRLGLRVTVSNTTALRNEGMEQVESLLHSKAECGIWVNYKKSPIIEPQVL
jgi:hypothetical protein